MKKKNLPKNKKSLKKVYENCQNRKKFRKIDKESFSDYVVRSQKDLASAKKDLLEEDFIWARVKAYQSLFHMLNALLVKNKGYYSKDHGCILAALLNDEIIDKKTAKEMSLILEEEIKKKDKISIEDALQDIDNFRIQRDFALYKPKAWEDITKEETESELKKIKKNIQILARLL